jgi:hypothetical protein
MRDRTHRALNAIEHLVTGVERDDPALVHRRAAELGDLLQGYDIDDPVHTELVDTVEHLATTVENGIETGVGLEAETEREALAVANRVKSLVLRTDGLELDPARLRPPGLNRVDPEAVGRALGGLDHRAYDEGTVAGVVDALREEPAGVDDVFDWRPPDTTPTAFARDLHLATLEALIVADGRAASATARRLQTLSSLADEQQRGLRRIAEAMAETEPAHQRARDATRDAQETIDDVVDTMQRSRELLGMDESDDADGFEELHDEVTGRAEDDDSGEREGTDGEGTDGDDD